MVSLERPARSATCVIDQLENRTHFAFGDLDRSWGTNGVLKMHDANNYVTDVFGLVVQPNGQLVTVYASGARVYAKRRLLNGQPDNSYRFVNQYQNAIELFDNDEPGFRALPDGSFVTSESPDAEHVSVFPTYVNIVDPAGNYINLPNTNDEWGVEEIGLLNDGRIYFGATKDFIWDRKTDQLHAAPRALWQLNDGTFLDQAFSNGNYIFRRYSNDLSQRINFGSKDSIALSYAQFPAYSFFDQLSIQGKYLVAYSNGYYDNTLAAPGQIGRLDISTGIVDRSFGTNGLVNLPFEFTSLKMLDDGSFVYARTSHVGKLVIGYIPADGKPDPQANTSWGAREFVYSTGVNSMSGTIAVGKSGEIYAVARSVSPDARLDYYGIGYVDNYVDSYIFKISMPTQLHVSIKGNLFNDFNNNQKQDAVESAIAGRTIYLDLNKNGIFDKGDWSTATDASGNYSFDLVPPGTYNVRRVLPAGYKVTNPLFSKGSITIKTGQMITANIGSVKV